MEIIEIKQIKKDLYRLQITDQFIEVPSDVLIKYNLLVRKKIEDNLLVKIKKESEYYKQLDVVLKYITKKLRSEGEVQDFLVENNFFDKKIMRYLKEKKYLDDQKYADAFVHDSVYLRNHGVNKIKYELNKRKVSDEIIEKALLKIEDSIFLENLQKIIIKKIKQNKKNSKKILLENILVNCQQFGYERDDIIEIFNQNYVEDQEIIINAKKQLEKRVKNKKNLKKELEVKLLAKGFNIDEIKKVI